MTDVQERARAIEMLAKRYEENGRTGMAQLARFGSPLSIDEEWAVGLMLAFATQERGAGNQGEVRGERVAELIEDGYGFWRPCSGRYETQDGQNVHGYPHSSVFKSVLGSGCRECGGVGAIWDDTDYDAMARDMLADVVAPDNAALVERLEEMPPTDDREPYYDDDPDGYVESVNDWKRRNEEAVEWLADNHKEIRAALRTPGSRAPSESGALAGKSEPGDDGLGVVG